jgi:aminopeptidase N
MANDRYTRSHDYDLLDQRISLRDFNWDSTSFEGSVITTLMALRPGLDSVILDAGSKLQIAKVTDRSGRVLRSTTHGDTLVVYLARPIAFRDTARFTVAYHGRVENGRGLTFIQSEGRSHRPQQIWSQGEDDNNHDWFPTYDFPNDKMTWSLEATVPRGYTAVSNGSLVLDRRNPNGTRTITWRQDKPSATYLVSLIVAPLVRIRDAWGTTPVDYYVYREDSARARPLFHLTPDMIDVFSRLTGIRYPWAKYAQTTVADFFGGMENVSATTLVDWLPDARAYADRPWYWWILIPHELAHQWFGDYVTTENWANMWLNEGFAEFLPGQYWATRLGRHAEDDYYLDEYRQFMQIDAQRRMPLAALGSNNIYPKGALVLRMLQRYLGPQRFWAAVRRYLTDHAYDNATTDDLRQAVLDATGENLAGSGTSGSIGRLPRVHRRRHLRLGQGLAHARGEADPGGQRHNGQHRTAPRHTSGVPHASDDPGRYRCG